MKPLMLILFAVLLYTGSGVAAPMLERKCDAQMVAEQMRGLSKDQFVEVVDTMEAAGAIDSVYAVELRKFINEAYSAPDIGAWVRSRCVPQTKTENRGDPLKPGRQLLTGSR